MKNEYEIALNQLNIKSDVFDKIIANEGARQDIVECLLVCLYQVPELADISAVLLQYIAEFACVRVDGGAGSGNHNHAGVPGQLGGSAPAEGAPLSSEEKRAIIHFTGDNKAITETEARNIETAIAKAAPLDDQYEYSRGFALTKQQLDDLIESEMYTPGRLTSWTPDESVAAGFAEEGTAWDDSKYPVVVKYRGSKQLDKGMEVSQYSQNPEEDEAVFSSSIKMKVAKSEIIGYDPDDNYGPSGIVYINLYDDPNNDGSETGGRNDGGPGSGNFNHGGGRGEIGGSAPGNGSIKPVNGKDISKEYKGKRDIDSVIHAQGFDGSVAKDSRADEEPASWITVNGNHIPIDESGDPMGGQMKALGEGADKSPYAKKKAPGVKSKKSSLDSDQREKYSTKISDIRKEIADINEWQSHVNSNDKDYDPQPFRDSEERKKKLREECKKLLAEMPAGSMFTRGSELYEKKENGKWQITTADQGPVNVKDPAFNIVDVDNVDYPKVTFVESTDDAGMVLDIKLHSGDTYKQWASDVNSKERKDLVKLAKKDPEFKELVDAVVLYTEGGYKDQKKAAELLVEKGLDNQNCKTVGEYSNGNLYTFRDLYKGQDLKSSDSSLSGGMAHLIETINKSAPTEQPLYRTADDWRVRDPLSDSLYVPPKVGEKIKFDAPTSFTKDKAIADDILEYKYGDIIRYELEPGANALNIEQLSRYKQKESLTCGEYEVVGVEINKKPLKKAGKNDLPSDKPFEERGTIDKFGDDYYFTYDCTIKLKQVGGTKIGGRKDEDDDSAYRYQSHFDSIDVTGRHDADEDIEWITVNGAHIPLKDGKAQAGGDLKGKDFSKAKSESASVNVQTSDFMKPKREYTFKDSDGNLLDRNQWIHENVEKLRDTYEESGGQGLDLEYWKGLTEQSTKDIHEIGGDYHDIQYEFVEAVGDSRLAGWFRNAEPSYKPVIVEGILSSPKTRNQALNLMYQNYKDYMDLSHSGDPLPFDEFINTPITLYRGGSGEEHKNAATFSAYTFDKKLAQRFSPSGGNIYETQIRPIDTWGSGRVNGEYEIFVPFWIAPNGNKDSVDIKSSTVYYDDDDGGRWITTENGHKVHINKNGQADKGNPNVVPLINGFTEEDIGCLKTYKSPYSYVLNARLRDKAGGYDKLSDEDKKLVDGIDHALKKAPHYNGPLVRYLKFEDDDALNLFLNEHERGSHIDYPAYTSFSKDIPEDKEAQVFIYIRNSSKGRDIESVGLNEREVLYERNSSFVVKSIKKAGNSWLIEEAESND